MVFFRGEGSLCCVGDLDERGSGTLVVKQQGMGYRASTRESSARESMFGSKKDKEAHRYYLLPGMGRSNRRKHREFLYWSLVVGLLVSLLFGYLLYLLSRHY
jgi:hypothetical protein